MGHLSARDYRAGLRLLNRLGELADDLDGFSRAGTRGIPALVGSDLTTLSVCDLRHSTRSVVSNPAAALSPDDVACFNRFFDQHPLVRYHASHPAGGSYRISDALPARRFRRTALYNEHYRCIGIDHVMAVPLLVDRNLLVSFVLNRSRRGFGERERAFLDALRGPLARLFRQALLVQQARAALAEIGDWMAGEGMAVVELGAAGEVVRCTPRAARLLALYCGGAQIATGRPLPEPAGSRLRERLYVKLGVETRTAAVMRSLALVAPPAGQRAGG